MMATAMVLGALSVSAGLVLSFHLGTAASATMALVPILLFFVVLAVRSAVSAVRGRRGRPGPGGSEPVLGPEAAERTATRRVSA